jgi:predicted dehydrogenase
MDKPCAAPPARTTTRRRFLQDSAVVASGALLSTLALHRAAHAAGDGTIKIGMIGSGGRCAGAAHECMLASPDVKLVAMCDVFADRVQSARDSLKAELPKQVVVDDDHCFTDFLGYQKVIDASDAVLIACASKFHPMYAEAAIKAGKHVFVEKPHGIDPVGVRRMEAACELATKKGLSLLSGLQSRYHAGYRECVQRIHDGAIGDVVAMQSMFLRAPYRVVARDPKLTETQYQFSNWYHFLWLSGDDVPQSLVHNVDRMCWILHEASPEWAFGLAGRSSSFGEEYGDMFDHHTVVYEYKNGARLYALCRTQAGCYDNGGDIIMGTKGQCDLGSCSISGETNWRFDKDQHNNPYQAEQAAFVESIKKGQPLNSGYHMNNATMITVMGQITCYTGKPVRFDEVRRADLQFGPPPEDATFDTPPPSVPDATGNYPLPRPGITNLMPA